MLQDVVHAEIDNDMMMMIKSIYLPFYKMQFSLFFE